MTRDIRNDSAPKRRAPGRKEWGHNADAEHQMEAREHARQPGRLRRAHGGRIATAAPQTGELRVRF